jgi:hypothetical protein
MAACTCTTKAGGALLGSGADAGGVVADGVHEFPSRLETSVASILCSHDVYDAVARLHSRLHSAQSRRPQGEVMEGRPAGEDRGTVTPHAAS